MKTMDLQGKWQYAIGDMVSDISGDDFILPGTTCENGIGTPQEYYDELNKETVRAPREKFSYTGALWLYKKIEITKEMENKKIRLFLERINMASELWVCPCNTEDRYRIGRKTLGLSTPHVYDLTGKVHAGMYWLILRIDNRNQIHSDVMASGYSIDTQGYWNGIIGRIELQWEDVYHIEDVQIYPKENGIHIRLMVCGQVFTPLEREYVRICLQVVTPEGKNLPEKCFTRELFMSKQVEYLDYAISDISWWDEFSPDLYTLQINGQLLKHTREGIDRDIALYKNCIFGKTMRFGMRILEVKDKEFYLNQHPIALRGTTDCAIFPLTGYPAMDKESWLRKFRIVKEYGLNHVRFHAWCPPENAFAAADELGIYLAVEMPLWLNKDVCPLEVGEDVIHQEYFMAEAQRISKTYGNHPSFMFFTNGNENMGDMGLLEDILIRTKAADSRRLYAISSNFDHRVLPQEDFLCAYEAGGKYVRMQNLQEEAAKDTCLNYQLAVKEQPVPVISFEIGQYCSFPDVDLAEKYTGNILPVNYDVIRKHMQKKGIYHKLKAYVKASGNLVTKLYKEEIECALRTQKFGGFQLLALSDYTGQDTAIVGLLDAFWESKGYIAPKDFRQFCGEVVPLFLAKRIYRNTEIMQAKLRLYDYGKHRIKQPVFTLSIYKDAHKLYTVKTKNMELSIPLQELKLQEASVLRIELFVCEDMQTKLRSEEVKEKIYRNTYRIFVGMEEEQNTDMEISICQSHEDLQELLGAGKHGIVSADVFKNTLECSFIPVFWSPVFFESRKPCGGMVAVSHPVFSYFPTEEYIDYQWKSLLDTAKSVDISMLGDGLEPMVEMVPNFVDMTPSSPLFELKAGKSKLLICGFDLYGEAEETDMKKQLRYSIGKYVNSADFKPQYEMTEEAWIRLCKWDKEARDNELCIGYDKF